MPKCSECEKWDRLFIAMRDRAEAAEAREGRLREELEQVRVQAAAVFVPLDGGLEAARQVEEGSYGWSPVFRRAIDIRERLEAAESRLRQAEEFEKAVTHPIRRAFVEAGVVTAGIPTWQQMVEAAHALVAKWRQAEERAALAQADRDGENERCRAITQGYRQMTKDIDAALDITAEQRQEQTGDAGLRSAVKLLVERAATLERERDEMRDNRDHALAARDEAREQRNALRAQVARLEEALRHQRWRTHTYSLACTGCEMTEAALAPPAPRQESE